MNSNINPTTADTSNHLPRIDNVPTEIFTYIFNHPQSESKKVINKVNWDIIPDLSSPDTATHYAKIIFQPSIFWMNK